MDDDKVSVISLVETQSEKEPELTMSYETSVKNDNELTMKLKLVGADVALTGQ